MKLVLYIILLSLAYLASSNDVPSDLQDIVDRITAKLRDDAKDNKFKDVFESEYYNKEALERLQRYIKLRRRYALIDLRSERVTGLENVKLEVIDWARSKNSSGHDFIYGKLSAGPIKIVGSVQYVALPTTEDGHELEDGTHYFELGILPTFEKPIRYRLDILADNHGHGKLRVEGMEPNYPEYSLRDMTRNMTSCDVKTDDICKDLFSFAEVHDGGAFKKRVGEKLSEAINRYILD